MHQCVIQDTDSISVWCGFEGSGFVQLLNSGGPTVVPSIFKAQSDSTSTGSPFPPPIPSHTVIMQAESQISPFIPNLAELVQGMTNRWWEDCAGLEIVQGLQTFALSVNTSKLPT